MAQFIHQPADKFFKESMTTIHVAKEFIEKIVRVEFLKQVDFSTLKVEKETFINKAFRKKEADLVYSVMMNGNLGYFYILCEHQGKIDSMMAFRLWEYIILIIEFHLRKYPGAPLPIVYPIVVYTGVQPWNAPLAIFDLFGENKELARKIFNSPYHLVDVQRISDEDLRKNRWSGLVKYVLKYQKNRANEKFLKNLFEWVQEVETLSHINGNDFLEKVLSYVVYNIGEDYIKSFTDYSEQYLSENLEDKIMTIAEAWMQQGVKKMQPLVFQAEQKAKQAEQQAKQAEQQAKQAEQQAKQAEQQAKQAEQQTKCNIAKSLLKKGLGLEMISEATQLPLQILQSLQAELTV